MFNATRANETQNLPRHFKCNMFWGKRGWWGGVGERKERWRNNVQIDIKESSRPTSEEGKRLEETKEEKKKEKERKRVQGGNNNYIARKENMKKK